MQRSATSLEEEQFWESSTIEGIAMPGKPWTAEEEIKLKQLVEAGERLNIIAAKINRPEGGVFQKAKRLGLRVVVTRGYRTTTHITLPKELPSVEEALKILAGALKAAAKSGLDKVEVQRPQAVATLARTYKNLLADYIDYRGIETKLVELDAKYAKLVRKARRKKVQNYASK